MVKKIYDSLKDLQPTDVLYPGMITTTNIGIVAKKAFIRANVEVGEPYNLRRSYCSDMFEMGIDPALYELCTDHSSPDLKVVPTNSQKSPQKRGKSVHQNYVYSARKPLKTRDEIADLFTKMFTSTARNGVAHFGSRSI